jgi:hypothetical protein
MSLGAIDFGLLVDGAVVMIENIVRRRAEAPSLLVAQVVRDAAHDVARPVALPPDAGTPMLGPLSDGLSEIYQFRVEGKDYSLMQLPDQIGAIVVGDDADPRRQRPVDLLHGRGQPLGDDARILAKRHQRDPHHGAPRPGVRGLALEW